MTVKVEITETLKRTLVVETENPEEAREIVATHYEAGNIVLGSEDYVGTKMRVVL